MNKPKCIWLTGLPCSGKTTIANNLQTKLSSRGIPSLNLDGDILRSSINSDLGFDVDSRNEAMRRVAYLSKLICSQEITAIVSVISPLKQHRTFAKELFKNNNNFFEIYLSTDIYECEKRDVKGMYKKARYNIIKDFTGISSEYEVPEDPFLIMDTKSLSIHESIEIIYKKIFLD
jgi:adenylyl-sulfate kinase